MYWFNIQSLFIWIYKTVWLWKISEGQSHEMMWLFFGVYFFLYFPFTYSTIIIPYLLYFVPLHRFPFFQFPSYFFPLGKIRVPWQWYFPFFHSPFVFSSISESVFSFAIIFLIFPFLFIFPSFRGSLCSLISLILISTPILFLNKFSQSFNKSFKIIKH